MACCGRQSALDRAGSTSAQVLARSRVASPQIDLVCVEPDDGLRARLVTSGLAARRSLEDIKGEFDFAYTFNVLEHIEDDRAALAALFRALKPGGQLLVYVPAFAVLFSAMDRKVGHVRRYIRRELMERCQAAEFEVESALYADSFGFFASLWLRAFGNTSGELNPRLVRLYDSLFFPVSRMLDHLTARLFGKNVVLLARRPLGKLSASDKACAVLTDQICSKAL